MTVHFLSQLSPSQTLRVTHFKLHCCFISSQNHQEKVWVFSSSLHMLWFVCYFLAVWVVIFCHIVFNRFTLCTGYGGLCLMLISSGIVLLVTMFLSLVYALTFVDVYTLLGNGYGVFLVFTSFVCMKVYLCLWFWISYLVSLCFWCHYLCVLLS